MSGMPRSRRRPKTTTAIAARGTIPGVPNTKPSVTMFTIISTTANTTKPGTMSRMRSGHENPSMSRPVRFAFSSAPVK